MQTSTTSLYTLSLHDALPIFGEYVAACLSGVFPVREALGLVAARGRLMQSLPPGDMLSVNLSEDELVRLITPPLAIAGDRKSTRLNSSHMSISYAVFCLKKKR